MTTVPNWAWALYGCGVVFTWVGFGFAASEMRSSWNEPTEETLEASAKLGWATPALGLIWPLLAVGVSAYSAVFAVRFLVESLREAAAEVLPNGAEPPAPAGGSWHDAAPLALAAVLRAAGWTVTPPGGEDG